MSAYASSSAGIEGEREGERGKRSVDRFDPEQPGRPRRDRSGGDKEGAQS